MIRAEPDGNRIRIQSDAEGAPSSVCAVWPHEYRKFAGFPHHVTLLLDERDKRLSALKQLQSPTGTPTLQVAVINYESLRLLEDELKAFAPDMITADESQRVKNHSAKQSKALHRLGDQAKFKLILTGTPITQDTRDIWSRYRFLDPRILAAVTTRSRSTTPTWAAMACAQIGCNEM